MSPQPNVRQSVDRQLLLQVKKTVCHAEHSERPPLPPTMATKTTEWSKSEIAWWVPPGPPSAAPSEMQAVL